MPDQPSPRKSLPSPLQSDPSGARDPSNESTLQHQPVNEQQHRLDVTIDAPLNADHATLESHHTIASAPRLNQGPATTRHIGDYELLEELARGGMGVVYKARHQKLNRIVALKMILAGQFASQDAIARFHTEAEAAASLDHPGITPIYDIGEHEGQPYFAMKLIDGGSVESRITEYEHNVTKSVQLLIDVARAMHHAHQRGILHRDLKPSNILLDERGAPLITDFGLAKRAEGGLGQTHTGAIMGTPAYMAPEQASGSKNITTASDVYSLGAILYRLLSGQPTYVASSALDVVMKSITEDPQLLRKIRPDIPLDLELICTKCLARDATERYASAADLAADLQRWLAGEPISLRPPTMSTMAGVWMKQHMLMAGASAAVGCVAGILLALTMYLGMFSHNFSWAASIYETYFPGRPRPWLALAWQSPRWILPLSLMIIPSLIALCGFFATYFARPQSRNAAASVGMIAGIVCGGLMGMMGVIGPQMTFTLQHNQRDLDLLAEAAFGSADAAKFAKMAALTRYPDLTKQSVDNHGTLIVAKLQADTLLGLARGLWSGTALFMLTAPLVVLGSLYAWWLQTGHQRFLPAFWRYVDAAFFVSLLASFLILFVAVRPFLGVDIFVPDWLMLCATLGILFVACVAAIRTWRWPLRILVHVAWVSCLAFYFQQLLALPAAGAAANVAAANEDFQGARDALRNALKFRSNQPWLHFQAGIVEAKLGNPAGYRQHCEKLLQLSHGSIVPEDIERVCKLCLLLPETNTNASSALSILDLALESAQNRSTRDWFYLTGCLRYCRSREWDKLREYSGRIEHTNNFIVKSTCDMINLLARCHQGESLDVAELELVKQQFESLWNRPEMQSHYQSHWQDRLIFQLLSDEVAAAVEL